MEMRYRLELLTCDGFVYCSTARSFRSAWTASERQTNRDYSCEMRILESRRDGRLADDQSWHVLAEIDSGQITSWNGQPLTCASASQAAVGSQLTGARA